MDLHNKKSRQQLEIELEQEGFERITLSFYRYLNIEEPVEFRNNLYKVWSLLNCFGRIYVAHEGINAQMSVPKPNLEQFLASLEQCNGLEQMPIKYAIEDNGKSFYKLTIKVRPKIVADGLNDASFDVTNVGKHLSALEWHEQIQNSNTLVIDMRNHYESEVGRFINAYCPDTDTFKETIVQTVEQFKDQKDRKILLYCTGGIRCEKASAYFKHHGFKDVNQLHGGIIAYANEMKQLGFESGFIGKNFVFDNRLGETVNGEVIAHCHQCGALCDTHTNCANDDCHLLFIQCENCKVEFNGTCSNACKQVLFLDAEEQAKLRKIRHLEYAQSKIFKSRLRPKIGVV